MNDGSQSYISLEMAGRMRSQAKSAWLAGLVVVLVWAAFIVAAPIAKSIGLDAFSSAIYHFFHFVCHQIPDRSFHVLGEQFAVCSRCTGVYFGLVVGFLIYPFSRKIDDVDALPRVWLFLSLIPISIDWSLTVFGIWENNHFSRIVTGLILGIACAIYIVPALVEIVRNITYRRSSRRQT